MILRKIKISVLSVIVFVLLSACGHPLPTVPTNIADQKKSVLVLSPPSVDIKLQQKLLQNLNMWKQSDLIAYEWIQQVNVVDEQLVQKISHTPYSYIIILGNELLPTALDAAVKTADKRWIIFQDAVNANEIVIPATANVALHQIDPANVITQWDGWVMRQEALGLTIQWVTNSANPIPIRWAPSEEADHILQFDLYGASWFTQLAYQVKTNQAKWIALYTPVDTTTLQTIKSLNIPIINLKETGSIILNWDTILTELLDIIHLNNFKKGIFTYNPEEIIINTQ